MIARSGLNFSHFARSSAGGPLSRHADAFFLGFRDVRFRAAKALGLRHDGAADLGTSLSSRIQDTMYDPESRVVQERKAL